MGDFNMPVLMKMVWEYPNNKKTTIEDWVKTLPIEEQKEFYDAQKRNLEFREQAIKEGRMVIVHDDYVWKNEAEYDKNKPHDPVWSSYFQRWLKETGIKFKPQKVFLDPL